MSATRQHDDLASAFMEAWDRGGAATRRSIGTYDDDFQALRKAGFTDAQIVEIVANIALNIFSNYFNSVAKTEVDFPLLQPGTDVPRVGNGQSKSKTQPATLRARPPKPHINRK